MSTRAGSLSSRITIERRGDAQDEWGQPVPGGWLPVAGVWANVRNLSGSEALKADAVVSTVRASIRIRWRTDIHAGMRVLVCATVYDIAAVLPEMGKREYVDLVCSQAT